ncbi:MAG: ABC-F family ATP-binding cassette domain-containing protein [Fimbriimonadaceae bacterium]|nr:ABC-F family ATP-binding cassette domain-containing protein [Fimbriimonadaceae bacterium]
MILRLSGVAKSYGTDVILEDASFAIGPREKVALVGRNGTGKTTLLRIITGFEESDSGSVWLAPKRRIAYLSQHAPTDEGSTVREEAERGVREALAIKRRYDDLASALESDPSNEELMTEWHELGEQLHEMEAYAAENSVESVLRRLGFSQEDDDRLTSTLSGGQRTRLALARLLLEEPDLLILDEPTNHLDLAATEWLESWVQRYPGAVLIVSHDRTFLERTADRFFEIRDHRVHVYPGPWAQYRRVRQEELDRQAIVAEKQAEEIAKLDEFVRRFMNSQRTAQARGRQKMMHKLMAIRTDAPTRDKGIAGGFNSVKRSGDLVIEAKRLEVGYPGKPLFGPMDWTVRFGDKWGVVGENGIGKSTLCRLLSGELDPLGGQIRLGSNVELGYFSQDAVQLDLDMTPLEFMIWEAGMDAGPARGLLGQFLFYGDDVYKPIRALSGGERNKLQLAWLTVQQPNLLVLDEPTNHLDMDSREALAAILRNYPGTLVLISHDRWLLSELTAHVLTIHRNGVQSYPGGFRDLPRTVLQEPITAEVADQNTATQPREMLSPREISKRIGEQEKGLRAAESAVERAEENVRRLEERLAAPEGEDVVALCEEHESAQRTLELAMEMWARADEELERLRKLQRV